MKKLYWHLYSVASNKMGIQKLLTGTGPGGGASNAGLVRSL